MGKPLNTEPDAARVDVDGFTFKNGRFVDPELEREFWERTYLQTKEVWNGLTLVLMISLLLIIGTYWFWSDQPKKFVMVSLASLFIVSGFARASIRFCWFEMSRHLVPTLCGFAGQTAALPLVIFSGNSSFLSPIAYICIMVGGVVHVKQSSRLLLVLYPAAVYVGFLAYEAMHNPHRYQIYHLGFAIVVVSLALLTSHSRERAERTEFIASRQKATALKKADQLLSNILPESVAARVKEQDLSDVRLVEHFESVTVLFVDLVGFTRYAATNPPAATIELLSNIFRRFDAIVEQCGVEKIKTMGDAYMAVCGLPERTENHARRIANAALEMREAMVKFRYLLGIDLELRIGIHSGPVIAGILGTKKFLYDIWGDTVNTASRLESHGVPGSIQVSRATRDLLGENFIWRERGTIKVKDKGDMEAYILVSPRIREDSLSA